MDADRRSNVSSFYGSRSHKSPFDPTPERHGSSSADPHRPRADSQSSSAFFNPNRLSQASGDILMGDFGHAPPRSAGYNHSSYLARGREAPVKGGRDEEELLESHHNPFTPEADGKDEGWDVYADFNNTGPRYSSAFGLGGEAAYQPLPPGASKPEMHHEDSMSTTGPVELVTVPALGAEWKKSELKDMTGQTKRDARRDRRNSELKAWWRDQGGICGVRWLKRKILVFIFFAVAAVIAIILAFTIPRVPSFVFNAQNPLSGSGNVEFSPANPTNFSFNTNLNVQIDTTSSYLPVHITKLHAQIFELTTNQKVAEQDLGSHTLPAKKFNEVSLPIKFSYLAPNLTDITYNNFHKACENKNLVPPGQDRQSLKLRMVLDMSIAGLINKPSTSLSTDNAACPFELAQNSS